MVFDLSRMRMQIFSPHLEGIVETRKSMGLPCPFCQLVERNHHNRQIEGKYFLKTEVAL